MKVFSSEIRRPVNMSLWRSFLNSTLVLIVGVILGIISKLLDETPSNLLPYILKDLDLRNFFSRIGIWIFLAVMISVYSKSPLRSAINVFLFFAGMLGSYYLYTIFVAGFFPKSYMMLWITITIISPFLAFVCWYTKARGIIGILISSIIFLLISRQAFGFGIWYFYIKYNLEVLLWIAMFFILYQSPKQIIKVVIIGLILLFSTAEIELWGVL